MSCVQREKKGNGKKEESRKLTTEPGSLGSLLNLRRFTITLCSIKPLTSLHRTTVYGKSLRSVICGLLILMSGSAYAEIPADLAVQAIMGEARGETLLGKTAVAEALRNRGHLRGVYGLKASFNEPEWVWEQARKAWQESSKTNLVKGADHWESTDFKTPYWAKNMVVTAHIGKHKFYKAVR